MPDSRKPVAGAADPAPYVPFRTFLGALEGFERGLPNQIDRSLWPSYSGAIRGQLLAAFRFLGLIDDGGCPSAMLRDMAAKPESRKPLLRALIEQSYEPLVALDLLHTSPHQLEEAMRSNYGVGGATHKKAVSFFLHAAQYSGLPISTLLRTRTRTASFGRRKTGLAEKPARAATPDGSAVSKRVELKSGGVLTLTASVDLFGLTPEDREFLFDLVDRMQRYK